MRRWKSIAPSTLLLGGIAGLGPFAIDSYLPAMPELAAFFGSSDDTVQLTLAATMLGFAAGQLVIGPWSDHIGRRVPLVAGLGILLISSVASLFATDISHFFVARFAQGFGAASAAVMALAIARDLHSGPRLVTALGSIALIQSLAPLVAPVVGALVLTVAGWRGIFVLLAVYSATLLALVAITVPETGRRADRPAEKVLDRYRRLFADRTFIGLLLLAAFRFTALFTFLQWSPFIFQVQHGLSAAQFGVVFAVMTLGMMAGLQLAPRLLRLGAAPAHVLWASVGTLAGSAGLLTLAALLAWPAWLVAACSFVFLAGCGLGLPMIQALALVSHHREAGTAAGLIGAIGFGSAALLAPVVQLLPQHGLDETSALAATIFAVAGASAVVMLVLRKRLRDAAVTDDPASPLREY